MERIERFVDLGAISKAGFSLVIDSMGGAGE
jgi:phosphoglucomutase